jgi:bacterioferritin-associated ferredoxin
MYVCSCAGVNDRTVRATIAAGAHTIDEVAMQCSAGADCGGCWPHIAELIAEAERAANSASFSAA